MRSGWKLTVELREARQQALISRPLAAGIRNRVWGGGTKEDIVTNPHSLVALCSLVAPCSLERLACNAGSS